MEDDLADKEQKATSMMKLAMDTLDKSLEAVRNTHRTAKRLRASVSSMEFAPSPRLVVVKK